VGVFVCDGTKVYRVVDNRLDGTQLQNDLDVLGDWTVKRQMNFNVVQSATGTFLIFFLSTVDTRNKVLYNNYLHDAEASDRRSAI